MSALFTYSLSHQRMEIIMADISFGQSAAQSGFLARLGTKIVNFIEAVQRSNSRARELERLNAMSDEALAEQGLRREDIVRHVFRDVYYL